MKRKLKPLQQLKFPRPTGALTVESVTIAIADLPAQFAGLRLAQLSDFHYDGACLTTDLLAAAIAAANAFQPDLVVLTGDFVTHDPAWIHRLVPWLQLLQSRYGSYAVLGNHDNYLPHSRTVVKQALAEAGIGVLWNAIAQPLGPALPLVGLADFWSREFDPAPIMDTLDPHQPRLVLSHNPDSAVPLQRWRVDLQISGHSHGGQIVIPGYGNLSERFAQLYGQIPTAIRWAVPILGASYGTLEHWEWAQGLYAIGPNQLYVNRGLGTYPPGRFNCPPEVTHLTLIPKSPPQTADSLGK